jgi:hypothetical protein
MSVILLGQKSMLFRQLNWRESRKLHESSTPSGASDANLMRVFVLRARDSASERVGVENQFSAP